MKATDLMIGDWVYLCHNDEWDTKIAGKVSLLSCGNSEFNVFPHVEKKAVGRIQLEAEDGFQFWQMDEGRNFEPIPLTPEILEKNGFEIVPQNAAEPYYWQLFDNETGNLVNAFRRIYRGLWVECSNPITESSANKQCEYVHELQHALRLCGIEKEMVV